MTDMEKVLKQYNEFLAALMRQIPVMNSEIRQGWKGWIENPQALKKVLDGLVPQENYLTAVVQNIDRSQTDTDTVKSAGLRVCGDIDARHLSIGKGDSETIIFIPVKRNMSPDAVDALVAKVGRYASFKGLCRHNQDNPNFAKKTPHFTQGKDGEGRHCCAAFIDWNGLRNVLVYRNEDDWRDGWFVAVVLASPENLET